jgi:hypothetical protein
MNWQNNPAHPTAHIADEGRYIIIDGEPNLKFLSETFVIFFCANHVTTTAIGRTNTLAEAKALAEAHRNSPEEAGG